MYNKESWQYQLRQTITKPDPQLYQSEVRWSSIMEVIQHYPMRITPYFYNLIGSKGDPIWQQTMPHPIELCEIKSKDDFQNDPQQSPAPFVIHRYPDRVLFMVSGQCPVYCRHCMRKLYVGKIAMNYDDLEEGFEYIRRTAAIKEVILSGGDPLMCSDDDLLRILERLRNINHVELLRIHTRVPCTFPHRITPELIEILSCGQPIFINIQFNHPLEITPFSTLACTLLADAGFPLGAQTVLLKGVNDNADILADLFRKLLALRVKPYYLHHGDPVSGAYHFRTSIGTGLAIMKHLRGRIPGIAVPQYMIDLPGGGGKIPLLPEYIDAITPEHMVVRNFKGETVEYPLRAV